MNRLSEIESRILKFIWAFWERHKNAPLTAEISEALGMSHQLVGYHLKKLDGMCYIEVRQLKNRTIIVPFAKE